ncbi:hypothetical protein C8J56DRAFT_1008252 [Mycena floridula]|nr:hypothetical protein C8J56DRAFT_1008252 [Mycena floridula]
MLPALLISLNLFSAVHCDLQRPFWNHGPGYDSDDWNLTRHPNANATGNLIFATASSFLQHWPATRYRNGHTVVVGSIAPGTLLYHAVFDGTIPTRPDWLATDPEHSLLSASNMLDGSLDSQDLIIWGRTMPEKWMEERERINRLCSWGKRFGIDGFVSEIMHCDFADGLDVVSKSSLVSDLSPLDDPKSPFSNLTVRITVPRTPVESIYAGSWHNHYPGDTRIRLDYSKLVSFYDTSLFPSLVTTRVGQTRIQHRLANISIDDTASFMVRLESILSDDQASSSGIDWSTLFRVIQDRFTDRIELLEYLLSNSNEWSNDTRVRKAHTQLHIILHPYILQSATPNEDPSNSWVAPIFELCSMTHTKWIAMSDGLSASERLLLNAVEETNHEICRVITNLWVDGVHAGLDHLVKPSNGKNLVSDAGHLVDKWFGEVTRLMKWLDWSAWVKCKPACDVESICYLPTWPYFKHGVPGLPRKEPPHPGDPKESLTNEKEDWEDPEPFCLRRIEPYDLPVFPDWDEYEFPS